MPCWPLPTSTLLPDEVYTFCLGTEPYSWPASLLQLPDGSTHWPQVEPGNPEAADKGRVVCRLCRYFGIQNPFTLNDGYSTGKKSGLVQHQVGPRHWGWTGVAVSLCWRVLGGWWVPPVWKGHMTSARWALRERGFHSPTLLKGIPFYNWSCLRELCQYAPVEAPVHAAGGRTFGKTWERTVEDPFLFRYAIDLSWGREVS